MMSTCKFNILFMFVVSVCFVFRACGLPAFKGFDIWGDNTNKDNSVGEFKTLGFKVIKESSKRVSKVLNFFPVPVEEECLSDDKRRKGICMNAYECRIHGGSSHGPCALGFGVCCIFTATCDQEIFNNLTYFVNPDFPDLSNDMTSCSLKVKKIDPEIAQLRLDFIHFNLGQPNRRTGVCEEDMFLMTGGNSSEFTLCGLNSGQHIYFDVDDFDGLIDIRMNLSKKALSRMWEVRVIQVPFTERAPAGCFQYHTGTSGIIRTMNFAENGRHLANQDYTICTRQEEGMCTIAYEPCDENSFRIGSNNQDNSMAGMGEGETNGENMMQDVIMNQDAGSGDGPPENRMATCGDRITMPCDSEDLIMGPDMGVGFCDITHCGNTLCPAGEIPCRIESSVAPYTIGVHFGPAAQEQSPEDNIGMCLRYQQLPCAE